MTLRDFEKAMKMYTKLQEADSGERTMTVAEWDRLNAKLSKQVETANREGRANGTIHDFRDDR